MYTTSAWRIALFLQTVLQHSLQCGMRRNWFGYFLLHAIDCDGHQCRTMIVLSINLDNVNLPPTRWQSVSRSQQQNLFHVAWIELHTQLHPTPVWLETWVARVPNFDCGCRSWLRKYLAANPPRYNDWYPWTVELHNAVNVKRGVAFWTPPA